MKGAIALARKEMNVDQFGEEKWKQILNEAGIKREPLILPISNLDDSVVFSIIGAAEDVLGLSHQQVADAFGEYWVNTYSQKMYQTYYRGSNSAREFLLKMDAVHVSTTKTMSDAHPPRFEYDWAGPNDLIMTYRSKRNMIDLLVGLIKGVGVYYDEPLRVTKLSEDKVKIHFP